MRSVLWYPLFPLMILASTPSGAVAQNPGSVELGFDLGLEVWMWDEDGQDSFVGVSAPSGDMWVFAPQEFRIAFWASENVSLEFPVGFTMLSSEGETIWGIGFGFFPVVNFPTETGTIPYFRVGARVNYIDGGFFDSDEATQWSVAGGGGVRIPAAPQLAIRVGAGIERTLSKQDSGGLDGHWDLQFDVGVSFFTPGRSAGE